MERGSSVTPCGLPACLLPWRPTLCSPGCYCRTNIAHQTVEQYPQGFGWYATRKTQDKAQLALLADRLQPYEWVDGKQPVGGRFVQGSAARMIKDMYEATKVNGLFEQTPEKFRGIFWMKGNQVGEELVSIQFGDYHPVTQEYLVPMAPFSWGWPAGKPQNAPSDFMYKQTSIEAGAATLLNGLGRDISMTPISIAFLLKTPPNADKTNSKMNGLQGDLRVEILNGWGYTRGLVGESPVLGSLALACCFPMSQGYVLNEQDSDAVNPAQAPGSAWWRGIRWGCCGFNFFPFGSYNLVKVLDGEGQPVQPYYDQFINYMGDVGIWTWGGNETP